MLGSRLPYWLERQILMLGKDSEQHLNANQAGGLGFDSSR